MKKTFYLLFVIPILFCFYQKYQKSEVAFTIGEKDLIPEGITYSSSTKSFYLSSLNKTKIIQIDSTTGKYRDFISSKVLGMMVLGLAVDESNKVLWACAESLEDNPYRTTVAKFDLETGRLLHSYEGNDTLKYLINDLVLDSKGNVYYTNLANHSVFKIDIESNRVELILKDMNMKYPNGITISPDDKYLYVASDTNGICVIDLKKRKLLNTNLSETSKGIDGLKFYKNSLIGIQNEVQNKSEIKIIRYFLDSTMVRMSEQMIIDQDNPTFDIPTTFVIVNNNLFCIANSQLGNYSRKGIKDKSILTNVNILKYKL